MPVNIYFSKNPNNLLNNINKLSETIVDEIYRYIPKIKTVFLNKQNYVSYHYIINQYILQINMEDYIRTTIRRDNDFVFSQMLIDNYKKWFSIKNYYYKNFIYTNYVRFLQSYADDNESFKCLNVIITFLLELGLSKNPNRLRLL